MRVDFPAKLANQGGIPSRVVSTTSGNGHVTICVFSPARPQSFKAFR